MIKQIESSRFESRQTKCKRCIYDADLSCSDKPCFPQDRMDGLSVYFVEVSDE